MKRVMLFWDFSNFKATVENLADKKNPFFFHYEKFARALVGDNDLIKIYFVCSYDIAYLISGDEDFVPAVEIVQQKGKIVVAVSARKQMSKLLQRRCDRFILIDNKALSESCCFENFIKKS